MSEKGARGLPAGYVYWGGPGAGLLLPEQRAIEETAARARRAETAAKAPTAEDAEAAVKGKADSPERTSSTRSYPAHPPSGWYRVLPRIRELIERHSAGEHKARCPDPEVRERNALILSKLIEDGPDRRVAQAPAWRSALDELEHAMPNFEGPIHLLRNVLALAASTQRPVRIPPMLLLGPPGVGKTYFSQRVAGLLGAPHAAIAFDQPSAGSQLRGSDKFWGNTETGLLFNLICRGTHANPVILLDEIDKAGVAGRREVDPLAQLHSALEPRTAQRTTDISVEIEFDASLVTYIATANSARHIGPPLLSRFKVFAIQAPDAEQAVGIAQRLIADTLAGLGLESTVRFERRSAYVLAHLSPRLMRRTVEGLVAAAAGQQQRVVCEEDVWRCLGMNSPPRLH
jgi:ATP-dependent Lon protease